MLTYLTLAFPPTRCRAIDTVPVPQMALYYAQRATEGGLMIAEVGWQRARAACMHGRRRSMHGPFSRGAAMLLECTGAHWHSLYADS
jgi:hypothetical protein